MPIFCPRATIRGMAAHVHNRLQVIDHGRENRLAPAAVTQLSALVGFRSKAVPPPIVALSLRCRATKGNHILRRCFRRLHEHGWAIGIKRGHHAQI